MEADIAASLIESVALLLLSTVAFVDAVEVLSSKLKLTRFATGALMAATFTALPETVIAVLSPFHENPSAGIVGMGSVLAAPSITVLVGAPVAALFWTGHAMHKGVAKNYLTFAAFITIAITLSQLKLGPLKFAIAIAFILLYIYLARSIYFEAGELMLASRGSFLERLLRRQNTWVVSTQMVMSAAGLLAGGDFFLDVISVTVNPLALALYFSPLATCLEEVLVAFYWVLKNKTDIALSLLSGENMIQSTFVAGVGMAFTEWRLPSHSMTIAVIYALAAFVMAVLTLKRRLRIAIAVALLYPLYLLAAA
ncbi:MAG: hypothetical protein QW544_04850 [Candidatus Caldarchaeum sp.]